MIEALLIAVLVPFVVGAVVIGFVLGAVINKIRSRR